MNGYWQIYGRLTVTGVMLGLAVLLDDLFTRPLAFVSGISQDMLEQYIWGVFGLVLTMLVARVVRHEILNGVLPRKTGKALPQLVIDLTGALIFFIGICLIFSLVFKRDITALVATGGASVMVIGLALRDMLLSAFTGILLNVEKPLKPGDSVRINGKWGGKVEKITWRATYLLTRNEETLIIPNLTLANAVIVNFTTPDARARRNIEVVIDFDTSVESAERILYAAVLGAVGVNYVVGSPSVTAIRIERDGVVYLVTYIITNYGDRWKADHAVIKSILQCMRDAGITVSFPKSEVIQSQGRVPIANRSLDTLRLVQQCRVFRKLPGAVCKRIAETMIERYVAAGATIVKAGEQRDSLFIVGEGMVKRTLTDRDGTRLVTERFIATEAFGLRALFCHQPQVATAIAETAALIYEFDRKALAAMIAEEPSLLDACAHSLALLAWRESKDSLAGAEPALAVIDDLTNLYRGQIHANYMPHDLPVGTEAESGVS
ncbi:MAG: mechanosensitive ion channel family protein [Magnetococcales bacterium]|nr:mechanosensitive ion channel family protein [Magnetococcales bacterium]